MALPACHDRPSKPSAIIKAKVLKKHARKGHTKLDASAGTQLAVESPNDFVDLRSVLPNIQLDIRYAGPDNFTGQVLYSKARCLLRRPVAKALQHAQDLLALKGKQLLVWDCYRPLSVQEILWKLVPDPRFVARPIPATGTSPARGSKHNRGAALDLSLLTLQGEPLAMPTEHDDFSPRARQSAEGISPKISARAKLLRETMEEAGFTSIKSEWWHFDHSSWRQYELSDEPL